jgi:HK97 family phage portal protein
VAEKRGLFKTIFGKIGDYANAGGYSQYRLLSTWVSHFAKFEGNVWEISVSRAAVDAFARNAAKVMPRHIRRVEGRREDLKDNLHSLLQFKPNPHMTAYAFYYRIAALYCIDNNVIIYPVKDGGKITALWPISASQAELLEKDGITYIRMMFASGQSYICPYDEVIHLRRHFKGNDYSGDDNSPLLPVLKTAHAFNQSMGKFAELISVIRGILKAASGTKDEDLSARRDDFIKNNLAMDSGGSGIIVTSPKLEYTPINEKQVPIPASQLEYVRREIYDYFGVSDNIVQNKAESEEMEAFYRGALAPFYMQLSQALTNGLFSEREQSFGHEIICELDRLQFETLTNRTAAAKFLVEIGAATLDQILEIFGLPPIGGEEGSRRVQTLNMVNADIADLYQLGRVNTPVLNTPDDDNKPDTGENEDDPPEGEEDINGRK